MSAEAVFPLAVDVVIVGSGTAGLAAQRAAVAVTPRVLLVERGPYGTTCARVGCMPSKLLIAAADAAHEARHAEAFGVRASVVVSRRAVMDRVRRERDRFVGFVLGEIDRIPGDGKLTGSARFIAPGVLDVSGARIHAGAVVVATGSTAIVPALFDDVRDRVVVSDDVFSWDELPESVAVFGAGIIGLELGQALHRLGVRSRIFGKGGRLGPLSDPIVRAAAMTAFGAELPIHLDARVHAVRRSGDGVLVEWADGEGQERSEAFACALVAAGRRASLAGLELERAGIELDARGGFAFDRVTTQVGTSAVFIAGDASAGDPFLHEAADEGRIAGENAARYPDIRPGLRRSRLEIVFTDPQLAVVGERHSSLMKAGDAIADAIGEGVVCGVVSFEDQGRSRVMRKNYGGARLYADAASGRFLGAELAAPRAEHLAHLLAWAHQQRLTVDEMLTMPFYHPVVEEGLRTALRDASAKVAARR